MRVCDAGAGEFQLYVPRAALRQYVAMSHWIDTDNHVHTTSFLTAGYYADLFLNGR